MGYKSQHRVHLQDSEEDLKKERKAIIRRKLYQKTDILYRKYLHGGYHKQLDYRLLKCKIAAT